jgi:hypothetical protein
MRTGRVVKASDNKFVKMENVPDEVVEFFERLRSKYKNSDFIVDIDPDTYEEGTEASIEIMVYDDYVE